MTFLLIEKKKFYTLVSFSETGKFQITVKKRLISSQLLKNVWSISSLWAVPSLGWCTWVLWERLISQKEQTSKLCSSVVSAPVPASMVLPWLPSMMNLIRLNKPFTSQISFDRSIKYVNYGMVFPYTYTFHTIQLHIFFCPGPLNYSITYFN